MMATVNAGGLAAIDGGGPISAETLETIRRLQANAIARAGADDFGPDDYLGPLALILEEGLQAPNPQLWLSEIELALIGRLVRQANWKAHPGYAARPIPAPLVICGIPRTGTTALHKLMSVDPQFQGLDNWLTGWPMPRPPRESWAEQPGFRLAVSAIEQRTATRMNVEAHAMVADEVDECLEVLRLDFVTNRFPSMSPLPRYDRWFRTQDETPFYQRLADTIRLIGLNDDRRWLLKNPGHFGHLDSLFAVFPDARVIITHRDPVKSIPSLCSVVQGGHRWTNPNADLTWIGRRELGYWTEAKARTDTIRAHHAEQILDIQHVDFHRDPIGVVEAIYAHAGLTLLPEPADAMRQWLADNPADKHGGHKYDMADYGLTPELIRTQLGEG